MSSNDKLVSAIVVVAVSFMVALYVADKWHEQNMQRIKNAKNQRAMSLQVELEQAKAEKMRYRALEVGYLCRMVDKEGLVYENGECE